MFKIKKLIFIFLLIFCNNSIASTALDKQLNTFFVSQLPFHPLAIRIDYVHAPPILSCKIPLLSLANEKKIWGKVTVVADCDTKKQFIQLDIKVTGQYVAAARSIAAGKKITENDIFYRKGRIDQFPDSIIVDKQQVINHIALHYIPVNQPIKKAMIQEKWHITAGQLSKVIIRGNGYHIVTTGKALSNAVLNARLNIKINSSGKIITGLVTNEGIIVDNKN